MRAVINLQRRTIDTQRMVKEINKEKETNRQKVKTECGRYLTWKDEQQIGRERERETQVPKFEEKKTFRKLRDARII